MRVCAYQCAGQLLDTDANLSTMETVTKACALQGARMVMFPELFLCGYNLGNDAMSVAETTDGKSIRRAGDIARENGVALLFGYAERAGSDVYNSAAFIGDTGDVLGNYRKVHLFGPEEKRIFKPGEDIRVIPYRGFKIGLLICYDIEFPEFVRSTVLSGADFLAVPTALTPEYSEVPTTIVRARAYENQIFVAYCDRIGIERDLTYLGMSGIVGPDGRDMARAGNADETILSADLDYDRYKRSRAENTYIRDRKPSLYSMVSTESTDA